MKRFIWRRYPFWAGRERQKAYDLALKIPLLSVRPMLLAHIPDIVAAGVEIKHSYQLYEAMVDAWLERESSWVDKQALRQFSEYLAVDLYLNREDRGTERVPREQLGALAQTWGIPLDTWQTSGRSLLNRDAKGNYKFAHRSVMEYLFILQLEHKNQQCVGIELTDQMKQFLIEMLTGGSPVFPRILQVLLPLDWTAECTTTTPADMLALQGQLGTFMEALEILKFSRSNPQSLEQALSPYVARLEAEAERLEAEAERLRVEAETERVEAERRRTEWKRLLAEWERLWADPVSQLAEAKRLRVEAERQLATAKRQLAEAEGQLQRYPDRLRPFSIQVPPEGILIFPERASDQTITQLFVVSFDDTTEHETSAWSVSVSPTQLDALKWTMDLRRDERFFYGLNSARMWRLALHFYSHGLSVAQMRSIQTRVRFEATSLVPHQGSIDGYSRFSLMRASAVVKRQLIVARRSLRVFCQAATSPSRVG